MVGVGIVDADKTEQFAVAFQPAGKLRFGPDRIPLVQGWSRAWHDQGPTLPDLALTPVPGLNQNV